MIGSVVRDFTANLLCLDEILAVLAYSKGGWGEGKVDKTKRFYRIEIFVQVLDRYFIYLRSNLFLSKIPTFDRNVECE